LWYKYTFLVIAITGLSENRNSMDLQTVGKIDFQKLELDSCDDTAYRVLLTRMEKRRKAFRISYSKATNRTFVLDSCRTYLRVCMFDSMFYFWENTLWGFYGTTEKPRCGEIACGYFVTTLLRDAGFQIPRVRWAEVASETFIREFCNNTVFHQIGKETVDVMGWIRKQKPQYFLVGLDTHVGIIEKRDTAVNFIHSAYFIQADGVTRETASGPNPFALSHYKVFGELLSDAQVKAWIMKSEYK